MHVILRYSTRFSSQRLNCFFCCFVRRPPRSGVPWCLRGAWCVVTPDITARIGMSYVQLARCCCCCCCCCRCDWMIEACDWVKPRCVDRQSLNITAKTSITALDVRSAYGTFCSLIPIRQVHSHVVANFSVSCHFASFYSSRTRIAIRYDTRCYFSVRWKADISQLNLLHVRSCANRKDRTGLPLLFQP